MNKKQELIQWLILVVVAVCLVLTIANTVKINKDYLTPEEQISVPVDPTDI